MSATTESKRLTLCKPKGKKYLLQLISALNDSCTCMFCDDLEEVLTHLRAHTQAHEDLDCSSYGFRLINIIEHSMHRLDDRSGFQSGIEVILVDDDIYSDSEEGQVILDRWRAEEN